MILKQMKLADLNAAAYNPRVNLEPGMPEFEKLKRSIETYGDVEPIVWNRRTGNVVGGHQRMAVMKHLGIKSAKVSVVDMDEQQEKLLNLALNKAKGDWDADRLESMLRDMDFDKLEMTGFGAEEIAILLESNDDIDDFGQDDGDGSGEANFYGASYVVTARFRDIEEARTWIAKEGIDATLQDGSSTTVIRFGEDE